MAKGQKRSNKEVRKPKQAKAAAPAQGSPFASQAKPTAAASKKK